MSILLLGVFSPVWHHITHNKTKEGNIMKKKIILIKYVWSIIISEEIFIVSQGAARSCRNYYFYMKILWHEVVRPKNNTKEELFDLHSVKPRLFTYHSALLCIKFLFFIFSYSATDFLAFHWKKWREKKEKNESLPFAAGLHYQRTLDGGEIWVFTKKLSLSRVVSDDVDI